MWEGAEQRVISAPREAVWAVVADVARHPGLAGSGEIGALRLHGPVGLGSTWEADIEVPGAEPFVARSQVLVFDPPQELCWSSEPGPMIPGEPQSEPRVTWWFRLRPAAGGTAVEHRFRVEEPEVGAEELREFFERTDRVASIRAGMRATLDNLARLLEAG